MYQKGVIQNLCMCQGSSKRQKTTTSDHWVVMQNGSRKRRNIILNKEAILQSDLDCWISTWSPLSSINVFSARCNWYLLETPLIKLLKCHMDLPIKSCPVRNSRYGHLSITDSFQSPHKILTYFLEKKTSIIRTLSNTDNGTLNLGPRE